MNTVLTIGMPVFNDIKFIEQSLISILAQKDVEFQLIISDDGATDGSSEICQLFATKDKRITFYKQEKNLGISKNMEFLLAKADTPFFMWAADDDLWDPYFAFKNIEKLKKNEKAIVSFCKFCMIDENNNPIAKDIVFDYSNNKQFNRLINFIKKSNDGFGYGVFKTEKIKLVNFPIWWWPNKKTPYNNIYPSLCFYLTLGDFCCVNETSLFYKRVKNNNNINHYKTGEGTGFLELIAFIIRRFNLITFSIKLIRKASNPMFAIRVYPFLFFYWFLIESTIEIKNAVVFKMKK